MKCHVDLSQLGKIATTEERWAKTREIQIKEYKAPEEHEKWKQYGAERTGESSVIIGKGAH